MPIVNGRYHMNPTHGRLVERNRLTGAFRGLAAQADTHKGSWVGRLINHLTTPRSATEPPPHPRPPGMPPEAYDDMKVNKLTVRQIANIVANENHDVTPGKSSAEDLQRLRTTQAHAVINADRTYGIDRQKRVRTAPDTVTPQLEHTPQYKQALEAARAAFQSQLSGIDPTGGRMWFNNRPSASTGPRHMKNEDLPVHEHFGPFQQGSHAVYGILNDNPKHLPKPPAHP